MCIRDSSTAICMGGYGAVFWMWMTAILGGATSFIESTLAQVYKLSLIHICRLWENGP